MEKEYVRNALKKRRFANAERHGAYTAMMDKRRNHTHNRIKKARQKRNPTVGMEAKKPIHRTQKEDDNAKRNETRCGLGVAGHNGNSKSDALGQGGYQEDDEKELEEGTGIEP